MSWSSGNSYIGPSKMKKMLKDLKKSYKKADELSKKNKEVEEKEVQEAENYLEKKIKDLDS